MIVVARNWGRSFVMFDMFVGKAAHICRICLLMGKVAQPPTTCTRQATSIATPMAWVTSFLPVGARTAPVAFSGQPVAHGSSFMWHMDMEGAWKRYDLLINLLMVVNF